MQVTPLEFGLAALVVVGIFGPKRLSELKHAEKEANTVDLRSLRASQPAAGRAPSPLAQRNAQQPSEERSYALTGQRPPQAARYDWMNER